MITAGDREPCFIMKCLIPTPHLSGLQYLCSGQWEDLGPQTLVGLYFCLFYIVFVSVWDSEYIPRASGLWSEIKWVLFFGSLEYSLCVLHRETPLL